MSYNLIRSMKTVQHCPHLGTCYLANNKISAIQGTPLFSIQTRDRQDLPYK